MKAVALIAGVVALGSLAAAGSVGQPAKANTQVVMLGTGSPRPDPERSGPATAIVVNNTAYLVDAGPGIVRRASAAADRGIAALEVASLRRLFLTHLHSDHTVGLPDLIFTTWVQGRRDPLDVVGPSGTNAMVEHLMLAWQVDLDVRTKGLEGRTRTVVNARDVTAAGIVHEDANVKVAAFHTKHGEYPDALGYKFTTADRTIVISGDTNPSPALIESCQKCDVLIHEAYSEGYRPADMRDWPTYRAQYHTTTTQLADVANKAQPRLLVVYHRGTGPKGREIPDAQYLAEIQRTYSGKVVIARDFDVY